MFFNKIVVFFYDNQRKINKLSKNLIEIKFYQIFRKFLFYII